MGFFWPAWDRLPLKTFYISLHSTKNLKENIKHPWVFKSEITDQFTNFTKFTKVYQFLKFILAFRFTFNAYAKNVREKTTKCSLKTAEVLLDALSMSWPKFDIYQSTVAPNWFKSHTNSWYHDFFQNKFGLMSDLKNIKKSYIQA